MAADASDPFDVVVPERDRDADLLRVLEQERPGILAWMVRGWHKFKRDGLPPPAKVLAATTEYREQADEVPEFVRDFCVTGNPAIHWASRAELYQAYLTFAESATEPGTLDRAAFYDRLGHTPGISRKDRKVRVNACVARTAWSQLRNAAVLSWDLQFRGRTTASWP